MRAGIALTCLLLIACGDDDSGGQPDATAADAAIDGGDAMSVECGNGEVEGTEQCDDGALNSDELADACRTDCTLPRCGDFVVDTGEACDDGPYNTDAPDGACRTDCTPAGCGDGILDSGEQCDDGNTVSGDGCADDCQFEATCGTIIVDGHGFAADALFLGDTDYQGTPNASAWTLFGEDLDGLTTTATDTTGHCVPYAGADPAAVLPDGPGGLDNSFGRNVLPIVSSLFSGWTSEVNVQIAAGQFSLLLLLEPILDPNQASVIGNAYFGAPLGAPPLWNGTDCWPVRQEDLGDPANISSARVQYLDAYVSGDRWESGGPSDPAPLVLRLDFNGLVVPIAIHHARIYVQLDPTHTQGTEGLITGVLHTEEAVELIRDALGFSDPSMCQGAAFDSVAAQIRQASDILADGTQDPTTTCDGITVGLGFTLAEVRLGEIAAPITPPTDPCP